MPSALAKQLYRNETLDKQIIERIEGEAAKNERSFLEQALKEEDVHTGHILQTVAEMEKSAVVDLERVHIDSLPLDALPPRMIGEHRILPLSLREHRLFVGIGNPEDKAALGQALSQARFHAKRTIIPVICNAEVLAAITQKISGSTGSGSFAAIPDEIDFGSMTIVADEDDDADSVDLDDNSPIVQYVNKVLRDAINQGASDIHIEPYETQARIRYRVDGVLSTGGDPPLQLVQNIASRIKVMARLDIAERRLPQDGRIKIQFSRSRTIDFRVSTMPTIFGEKIVMRILDQSGNSLTLETLGMEPEQLKLYQTATAQPHGMILVTGPTGSGKTVTLYSALDVLNKPDVNISSAEDPVEIYAEGINQVSINDKYDLTFARVLRAFLRQDPDVLMVGEIRDLETAEIAIKAAQTGHLVLSTLHTNDGPSTITRMINMGVAPFNIASTVNLVIAQRLVRRLCNACKRETTLSTAVLLDVGFSEDQIEDLTLYEPVGCNGCTNGYSGRTGIYEMMPISDQTAELIMNKATEAELGRQVREEGTLTLKQQGIKKVVAGITSLAEVERVTKS